MIMSNVKTLVCAMAGVVGSAVSGFLGGWDHSLSTLFVIMIIDYIFGIMVGGIFHNSPKTDSGKLESHAGFKGICKKFAMMLVVVVCHELDIITGLNYLRDGVCIAFCANEVISIVENLGLMGISVPILNKAIAVLQDKETKEIPTAGADTEQEEQSE